MTWFNAIRLLRAAASPVRVSPSRSISLGSLQAELFIPTTKPPYAGILLSHGFTKGGSREPRVVQLASGLSQIGFLVLVPTFPEAEELHVSSRTLDQLSESFLELHKRSDVYPNRCGIFGISYGATLGLIAASNEDIAKKIDFVISLGGYASLRNLITYGLTGHYPHSGPLFPILPDPFLKLIFEKNPDAENWIQSLSISTQMGFQPELKVVLIHSLSDAVVPWKEMERLHSILRGQVKKIRTHLIQLEGHARITKWFSGLSTFRAAYEIARLA